MSQENIEILRGGYEWFRLKKKFPAHLAAPDFTWDMSHFHGWPEQQVYQGVAGADAFLADWGSAWDDWQLEIDSLHEAGDRVLALVRQHGRSKISGMLVEMSMAMIWTFRDAKETRVECYSNRSEALKAVGLEGLEE